MSLLASIMVISSVFASTDARLQSIVDAYGGSDKLEQPSQFYAEGKECFVNIFTRPQGNETCSPVRIYRRDPYRWRKESPSDSVTLVVIYRESDGIEFYEGPLLTRVFLRLVQKPPSVSAEQVRHFWDLQKTSVDSFLLNRDKLPITFDGLQKTFDGKFAWSFSVPDNGSVVHYFFDPDTKLCLQESYILPGGYPGHTVYGDYRDVQGVPRAHHLQRFYGDRLITESFFDHIDVPQTMDDKLFEIPTPSPRWLLPLVVGCILATLIAIILVFLRRFRRVAHP